jgi:hypothetical protein
MDWIQVCSCEDTGNKKKLIERRLSPALMTASITPSYTSLCRSKQAFAWRHCAATNSTQQLSFGAARRQAVLYDIVCQQLSTLRTATPFSLSLDKGP